MDDKIKMDRRMILGGMLSMVGAKAFADVYNPPDPEEDDECPDVPGGPQTPAPPPWYMKWMAGAFGLAAAFIGAAAAAIAGFMFKEMAAVAALIGGGLGLGLATWIAGAAGFYALMVKMAFDIWQDPPRKDYGVSLRIDYRDIGTHPYAHQWTADQKRSLAAIADLLSVMQAWLEATEKRLGAIEDGQDFYVRQWSLVLQELEPIIRDTMREAVHQTARIVSGKVDGGRWTDVIVPGLVVDMSESDDARTVYEATLDWWGPIGSPDSKFSVKGWDEHVLQLQGKSSDEVIGMMDFGLREFRSLGNRLASEPMWWPQQCENRGNNAR